MGWPGLALEVQEICRVTGLPDITQRSINPDKMEIKEAMKVSHLLNLLEEMKGVKLERMKISDMRTRRSCTKWSIEMCRMAFMLECQQFDCRANMPNRYNRDLVCQACRPQRDHSKEQKEHEEHEEQEDQEHLKVCPG